MRTAAAIAAVVAVAIVAAACGDDDERPVTTDGSAPATLDGRELVVSAVTGHQLAPGTTPRFTFEDGVLMVHAGCNTLRGGYELDGARLVVGELAMTEIGCEPELMEQDQWFADVLGGGTTVSVDGATMTLSGEDATITLTDREVVEPDVPLEGTTWTLDGIISGDAVSSVPGGAVATIRIEDAQAFVDTSCNTGSAVAEVRDDSLFFGPLALTRKACPPDRTDIERLFVALMTGEVGYAVEADTLTLTSGERGLTFRGNPG